MAVFRVERTSAYTVMSNHHLRDGSLSLKAKGLLSQMLSLPEDWDYTLDGLAKINKESKDAIRSAVVELEKAGYVQRRQSCGPDGKFSHNEYVIHELPTAVEPSLENPTTENPATENPLPENPTEINKEEQSKELKEKVKKEKSGRQRKKKAPPVTDFDPLPLFIAWLGKCFPDRPPAEKNAVYLALQRFCEDRAECDSPVPSKRSVTALCNKLVKYTGGNLTEMVDLLDTATLKHWDSVFPPNQYRQPPRKYEETDERDGVVL